MPSLNTSLHKFEIHYYLQDSSHSLNALIKNKCEADFLALVMDIAQELDINTIIESEAIKEGGLKEIWTFIGDNSNQISVLLLLITAVCTYKLIPDNELKELQKEESRLNIQKLKKELGNGKVNPATIEKSAEEFSRTPKVMVRKSGFYKKAHSENKITKIGYTALNHENKPLSPEKDVKRKDFINFVMRSNKLPLVVIEDALIEIVSPVFRDGKAKWKGIYNDDYISFKLKDNDFKNSVISGNMSFKSGDAILCVLEIHKELNELGDVKIAKYVVPVVLEKISDHSRISTKSGQIFQNEKKLESRQQVLNLI